MKTTLTLTEDDCGDDKSSVVTVEAFQLRWPPLFINVAEPDIGISGIGLTRQQAFQLRDFLNAQFPKEG